MAEILPIRGKTLYNQSINHAMTRVLFEGLPPLVAPKDKKQNYEHILNKMRPRDEGVKKIRIYIVISVRFPYRLLSVVCV